MLSPSRDGSASARLVTSVTFNEVCGRFEGGLRDTWTVDESCGRSEATLFLQNDHNPRLAEESLCHPPQSDHNSG